MTVDGNGFAREGGADGATLLATGIHADPERGVWALVTERSAYALGVTPEGHVVHLHWGGWLGALADLPAPRLLGRTAHEPPLDRAPEEYPAFGGLRFGELAAKATFADGTRDLDLRYDASAGFASGFEIEGRDARDGLPALTLRLRDAVYPLTVTLRYQLDSANDLLVRSAAFTNTAPSAAARDQPGDQSDDQPDDQQAAVITLERVFSAVWQLPRPFTPRTLTTLAGQWGDETHIQRRRLVPGVALVESRRGITSLQANPWFAVEHDASETTVSPEGAQEVYFGALAWSGNWALRVATEITGATAIAGGINDADFAWRLAPGQTFTTPDFVAGFADDGLNGARRRLHRYTRERVLPKPQSHEPRPVLYNSWEATTFDVNEEGQAALAERAARLGVELFVMDDGWFLGRDADNAGLGDWRADPRKFPQGLNPLIRRVHELGMDFGIWVEPEMVNPNSELYRAHPEWVYHFPTRPRSEARNQLVLNLGRADVRAYLFDALDTLVSQHAISFLKWDMNRPLSEPGWPDYLAEGGEARELWVRHVEGVYALMDDLRAKHPQLSVESCASGGGRADLGILRRTDQIWTSDNTHPEARLFIQEGFSLPLPARVMTAWVTDAGRGAEQGAIPLAYRFHVAMLGTLGVGGHLMRWTEEELDEAARWIAVYKAIRPLVQDGEQRWLLSPHATGGELAAAQYTSEARDEAVVFAFRRSRLFFEGLPPLRLQGLQPDARYAIETLGVAEGGAPGEPLTGATAMARGLALPLLEQGPAAQSGYASCVVRLRRV